MVWQTRARLLTALHTPTWRDNSFTTIAYRDVYMLIEKNYMFSTAISVVIAVAGQANAASCPAGTTATSVEGKIFNNVVSPTGTVVGTVHLEVGGRARVKCGLLGNG